MSEPAGSGFTLTPLRRVTARLVAHDWAWARAHAAEIDRNWRRRRADRPDLFDGTVLLGCGVEICDGACDVSFFAVPYAQFLAFRDAGSPDAGVANAFAAIVPGTADSAVLLGTMAAHTANAGQVYFPCGTPDLDDVRRDGSVDLAGSAARELAEETGLALPEGSDTAPWMLVRGEGQLAFLKPIRFEGDAGAIRAAIDTHCAAQARSELAGIVTVRARSDIDRARMPGFVCACLGAIFTR